MARHPEEPLAVVRHEVRTADLWRATGVGLCLVWGVVLCLLVGWVVRLTLHPAAGDPPPAVRLLLVPVALVCAGSVVWVAVAAWRIHHRRTAAWDGVVVVGALGLVSGVVTSTPWGTVDGPATGRGSESLGLAVLGLLSVATGLLAQRSWRRAAGRLEELRGEGSDPG
ncbi:LPXTG cell wall anchor domain-containing protein [Arthrobacter sp. NEB 688]|uniref:LPXTG cell wall anchor domain-containing protein n=1 Tax=Arthrobacter sp. NEB 688 TaxID=904039 RepID=UPI0015675AD8|nr:LPXTG cell wall anchor domain-containing protein [Arthrobacter sp. NEB 688]QKE84146.1 LPXTG cell wall anchor domain-containing protein [Arthrobacter sp. NEB 688]